MAQEELIIDYGKNEEALNPQTKIDESQVGTLQVNPRPKKSVDSLNK